jgi:hypothetical protein
MSSFLPIPDSAHIHDNGHPSSPPSTTVSRKSSCVSIASTFADADDEDIKGLRGLLLRKIETRIDGSFEEIDKVTTWLRIVKEVVRGVKNRAGL